MSSLPSLPHFSLILPPPPPPPSPPPLSLSTLPTNGLGWRLSGGGFGLGCLGDVAGDVVEGEEEMVRGREGDWQSQFYLQDHEEEETHTQRERVCERKELTMSLQI